MLRKVSSWGQLLEAPEPDQAFTERHDRRLWVRYECDMEASCQEAHAPDREPIPARVRDISRGGVRLVVPRGIDRGGVLSISLPGEAGEQPSAILACVIHSSPLPDGQWVLGCTFVSELTDEDLSPFGAERVRGGPSDQRTWQRFP